MASILRRFLQRLGRSSERGAEFVEFALAFPLLLLVVLGIIDFGLMFQQYEVLTNAAREGARLAVLPIGYTPADVQNRVQQYIDASFLSTGGTVNISGPTFGPVPIGGGKCITAATVTVTYHHDYIFLGGIMRYFSSAMTSKDLKASSTMRTEAGSGSCT